jgi:hypothetical protein
MWTVVRHPPCQGRDSVAGLKGLITGGTGRTVVLGAICYQIANKNMASGFGAESWGIGPFTFTEFADENRASEDASAA